MWWRRKQREDDLDRELRSHLDLEAEEQGDRFAAQRAFGNLARTKEDTRSAWGWTWIETVVQDLRYATRNLGKKPEFSAVAIASLALGIGASTAIFTVVNAVLLRPLPYPEPEKLVRLWETKPKESFYRNVINGWNFVEWRERNRSLEAIAAIDEAQANLTGQGEPVAIPAMQVSGSFFPILRVPPLIGRTLTIEDETAGRDQVVVLSYSLWQSHFGGDPGVLGKRIDLYGSPHTVVGVMPAGFSFPSVRAELWTPMLVDHSPLWERGRGLSSVARLKPGVTLPQAREDLTRVAAQLAEERDYDRDWSAEVIPLLEDATGTVRTALLVLMGAVGFLLAIACANVANLFLMRGAERLREIALRETLGASKLRVFRQYLTESLLITFLAAAAGLVAGNFGVHAMLSLLPAGASLPRVESIELDAPVFALALAAAALTAILFGSIPLLHSDRVDLQKSLRLRSHTAGKSFRYIFVTVQIALALALLTGAGLSARSFSRLISVDPGFSTGHLLTMDLFTSPARFSDSRTRSEYFDKVLTEIRAVPGVENASSTHVLPLEQRESGSCFSPPVDPPLPISSQPNAQFVVAGTRYFVSMGIPLVEGRDFTERDRYGSPTAILVNRAFARRYYPNESPVGKHLNICWTTPNPAEIVGVAGDARQTELSAPPEPTIFVANLQAPSFFATLVIRSRNDPSQIARSVMAAIHRVNTDQAVSAIQTMDEVAGNSVARPRFQFLLLAIFACAASLLAALGVYGVVSYSVAQRTQEIGVRVAVGATRGQIAGLVLKEGLLLSSIGAIAGLAGTFAVTRFLKTLLYQIAPTDPVVLSSVCGLLLAIVAVAIVVPLRRATRVDPMTALRHE